MQKFQSNGKLLITGEYLVLDGAMALAVPTKFGQSLEVTTLNKPILVWKSFDFKDDIWFETVFKINHNEISTQALNNNGKTERLLQILQVAKKLNPGFLKSENKASFTGTWWMMLDIICSCLFIKRLQSVRLEQEISWEVISLISLITYVLFEVLALYCAIPSRLFCFLFKYTKYSESLKEGLKFAFLICLLLFSI